MGLAFDRERLILFVFFLFWLTRQHNQYVTMTLSFMTCSRLVNSAGLPLRRSTSYNTYRAISTFLTFCYCFRGITLLFHTHHMCIRVKKNSKLKKLILTHRNIDN